MAEKDTPQGVDEATALKLLKTRPELLGRAIRWGYIPKPTKGRFALVDLIGGWTAFLESGETTQADVGVIIGLTRERVRQLVEQGVLKRNRRGNLIRDDAVRAYIEFTKDEKRRTSATAGTSRLQDAKTREIEMRTRQRDGELVDREEVEDLFSELCGLFVAGLSGLPAAVTTDRAIRQKIEATCDGIRRQIVSRFTEGFGDPAARPRNPDAAGADDA